jgi:hypothetical protein
LNQSLKLKIEIIGFVSFFLLATAPLAITSIDSYVVLKYIRIFSFFSLLIITGVFFVNRIKPNLLLFFLFIISFFYSVIYNYQFTYFKDFLVLFIGLPFVYAVINKYEINKENTIISFLFYYFLCLVLLTLLTGGFTFERYLGFNFSYASNLLNNKETYSLGASNIYFMFSLVFLYAYLKRQRDIFYLFLTFFSTILAVIGAGRGELIAWVVMIVFMSILSKLDKGRKILFYTFVVAIIVIFLTLNHEIVLENFSLIRRLTVLLDGNMSSRDLLIENSFDLLGANVNCLLVGCGSGFFQYYHQYPESLYPHNSALEFIISYGLPMFLLFLTSTVVGLYKFYKASEGVNLIFIIFAYQFIISLKSSYLFGSYLFITMMLSFVYIGWRR